MNTESLLGLLQFADGLFPAGGHAHSFGLETYVLDGGVRTREDVQAFIEALLIGSAAPGDAVALVAAARAAHSEDEAALRDLDERLDAQKPAPELREASRQMGRQTLRAAAAVCDDAVVMALFDDVDARRTPGHHAVAFGVVGQSLGVADEDLAAAYLYSTAVVVANASLRLLALGQLDGQRILASLRPLIARLAHEAASDEAVAAGPSCFNPGLDAASLRHARLEARLFRS